MASRAARVSARRRRGGSGVAARAPIRGPGTQRAARRAAAASAAGVARATLDAARAAGVVGAGHVPGIKAYWDEVVMCNVNRDESDKKGHGRALPANLEPLVEEIQPVPWERTQCNVLGCCVIGTFVGGIFASYKGSVWLGRNGPTWWAIADTRMRIASASMVAVGMLVSYRTCCGVWPCTECLGCGRPPTLLQEAEALVRPQRK